MKKINLISLAVVVISGLFLVSSAFADTLYVPTQYPTIQAAINAAQAGDTVYALEGTYNENITMKTGVDVIGENKYTTILTTTQNYSYLVQIFQADNCSLSGFTLTGPQTTDIKAVNIDHSQNVNISDNIIKEVNHGIYLKDNLSANITNNIISDTTEAIITYWDNSQNITANIRNNTINSNERGLNLKLADNSNVSVINNVIYGHSDNGIGMYILSNDSFLTIKNNIVTSNKRGIYNYNNNPASSYEISYNDVWGNSEANYSACSLGDGNISENPLFVYNFHLQPVSPCVDAGTRILFTTTLKPPVTLVWLCILL